MVDGPFGATFDFEPEAATTPDDGFEDVLVQSVGLSLRGLHIVRGQAYPSGGRRYIRPDIVVRAPGTSKVFLVADAKRRKRISARDVDKLARYRKVLRAEKAAIACLESTAVSQMVSARARRRRIAIVRLTD